VPFLSEGGGIPHVVGCDYQSDVKVGCCLAASPLPMPRFQRCGANVAVQTLLSGSEDAEPTYALLSQNGMHSAA
jgi:hypothetical protein